MKKAEKSCIRPRLVRFSGAAVSRPILDVVSSCAMKSELVVLKPGESVGKHVTTGKEEVIIILTGTAAITCGCRRRFVAPQHSLVYIPPDTEHDVANKAKSLLRYVYVVSRIK